MLVRLLNEKGVLPVLMTWLVVTAVWIFKVFVEQGTSFVADQLAFHWALGWISDFILVKIAIAALLLILIGLLVRELSRRMKISSQSGNVELLVTLVLILTQKEVLFRADILIGMAILLFILTLLVRTYKQEHALSEFFHTGLLLGIACLFVGQLILFFLTLYFALFVLRQRNWRERIAPIIGLLMSGILIGLVVIWSKTPFLEAQWIIGSTWIDAKSVGGFDLGTLILSVLVIPASLQLLTCITAGTITERNYSLVLLGWILVIILMPLILGFDWRMALVFGSFPLAIYLTRWLTSITRWWLADLILLAILAAPILNILWPT